MNYIPGGRMIKKYVLRMIAGILLLPGGPILLFWNESKAITQAPLYDGMEGEGLYWLLRVFGFLFTWFCIYRISSAIKLFMMKIPLSYKDIRMSIYVSSCIIALAISLVCMATVWLLTYPIIGTVLIVVAVVLLLMMLIRRKQERKKRIQEMPSVKPHQTEDV